jgi:hypothetical protein
MTNLTAFGKQMRVPESFHSSAILSTPSVLKYKAFNGSKFVPKYKAS